MLKSRDAMCNPDRSLSLYYLLPFVVVMLNSTLIAYAQAKLGGDGLPAPPVIQGDRAPLPVASNSSSIAQQNKSTIIAKARHIVYLRASSYSHNTKESMGKRIELSINLDTIKDPMKLDILEGLLNTDLAQLYTRNVTVLDVSNEQLARIEKLLYSSQVNKYNNTQHGFSYLPIVRKFSHYSVLLAVVLATVLFSLAAYGLTMGEKGSSQRIIGTAAGLIILLMAFSIYKLLMNHAINDNFSERNFQSTQ